MRKRFYLDKKPLDSLSAQAIRPLAERIAAYLPQSLTRRLLAMEVIQPGKTVSFPGAILFADMSGFTRIAEELAEEGPQGAETLNRTLLMAFTGLIDAIHAAEGVISHFHGDAMMVVFSDADGRAAQRALGAASFMQSLMSSNFWLPPYEGDGGGMGMESMGLNVRIGLGYGHCVETIVGSATRGMEYVLGGAALEEAVSAQQEAAEGEVVAGRAILSRAGLAVPGSFRVVNEVSPVPTNQRKIYWEAYDAQQLGYLVNIGSHFIPAALFERLTDRDTQFVADHRPVTSLFVQIEGLDFADTTVGEQLQSYYLWATTIVERYGGGNSRVNRILTGDKGNQLHILFGAPVAPDAPVQALRCALAMQRDKPANIGAQRIGLANGRVFAGAVGSRSRREYTTVGRVVNISSRLAQFCPPGTVLVDDHTADRLRNKFVFQPRPPIPQKSSSTRLQVSEVIGEHSPQNLFARSYQQHLRSPMVRQEELQLLYAQMLKALQGKGGLVTVAGSYGSGQLSLLANGAQFWQFAGGKLANGLSHQHTQKDPFGPWHSIWKVLLAEKLEEEGSPQGFVNEILPDLINGQAPSLLWNNLIGFSLTPLDPSLSLATEMDLLAGQVVQVWSRMPVFLPLLVIIEDVHWADEASMQLLSRVASRIYNLPLLMLVTYQSGLTFPWPEAKLGPTQAIFLRDLTLEKAYQLIQATLGVQELPLSVEKTLGIRDFQGRPSLVNPLFLEETLKMMVDNGVFQIEEQEDSLNFQVDESKLETLQVPDSIYALLLARLDQLSAAGRTILQISAVLGREFTLELLAGMDHGLPLADLHEVCQELVNAELIQCTQEQPTIEFRFIHAMIHEAVYQSLPFARRQALHATIADHLARQNEGDLTQILPLLAYHIGKTGQHEIGVRYALAAGENSMSQESYHAAASFYRQALDHWLALRERQEWQTAVRIHIGRARAFLYQGQFAAATLDAADGLKICLPQKAFTEIGGIYNFLVEVRLAQGDFVGAMAYARKIIESHGTFPDGVLARAHTSAGIIATNLMEWNTADSHFTHAEHLCQGGGESSLLALVLAGRAWSLSQRGFLTQALVLLQKINKLPIPELEICRQILLIRAELWLRACKFQRAEHLLRDGESLMQGAYLHVRPRYYTLRAKTWLGLHRNGRAEADLRIAQVIVARINDHLGKLDLHLTWGCRLAPAQEKWQEVREHLKQAGRILAEMEGEKRGLIVYHIRHWVGLGQLALWERNWAKAQNYFELAQTIAVEFEYVWLQPEIYYGRGMSSLLESGDYISPHTNRKTTVAHFYRALQGVYNGGDHRWLPLILIQLAELTPNSQPGVRDSFLRASLVTALRYATARERPYCLRKAGLLLLQRENEAMVRLAQSALARLPK